MSKTSFRSRNIDPDRPIPIYHIDDLSDLNDYAAVSRSIVQMPTGMEKDEEAEQHFQIAMEAQALYGATGELVIPVPEVTIVNSPKYPQERRFNPPKSYFKQSLNFQEAIQNYDADSDDEVWLKQIHQKSEFAIDKGDFENCIDKLEWLRKIQPHEPKLNTIETLITLPLRSLSAIFEYWKLKRKNLRTTYSLCPDVRTEQADGVNSHDPYVAFRKRFEKMQTRKNRKFEEQLFERLMRTHINITRTENLFKTITQREVLKLQYQQTIKNLFSCRMEYDDYQNKAFQNVLTSHYKHRLSDDRVLSNLIGNGVIEFNCFVVSHSEWRLLNIRMPSLMNKVTFFYYFLAKVSPYIRNVNAKASFVTVLHNRKRSKSPTIDLYRDSFGNLVRYRYNRSRQLIRDYVHLTQPTDINIIDEPPMSPLTVNNLSPITELDLNNRVIFDVTTSPCALRNIFSDEINSPVNNNHGSNGRYNDGPLLKHEFGISFISPNKLL